MFKKCVYDKEIIWNIYLKELFGNSYNDYLERRKYKMLKELSI